MTSLTREYVRIYRCPWAGPREKLAAVPSTFGAAQYFERINYFGQAAEFACRGGCSSIHGCARQRG